jgi:hypothetical protein
MLIRDALWLVEESALDEPADLLTIPEIKQHVVHVHDLHDEGLGLRALLERPEALPGPWWHEKNPRPRRASAKSVRRQSVGLRAA